MGQQIPFMDRLKMAWRVLFDVEFVAKINQALHQIEKPPVKTELPPEKVHASGLMLLAALQREGRLVDFLRQEVSGCSDEDVGAAARVVHGGCRKVLQQFFEFEPAVQGAEGMAMSVPPGFDIQRIRAPEDVSCGSSTGVGQG